MKRSFLEARDEKLGSKKTFSDDQRILSGDE
jgi:hypothetical protein